MKFGAVQLICGPHGNLEAFQKGMPAEGSLFMEHNLDGALQVERGWSEVIAPSVEGGEDLPCDGWGGVRAIEVSLELPEGTLPNW
jgi:hypothetical protein